MRGRARMEVRLAFSRLRSAAVVVAVLAVAASPLAAQDTTNNSFGKNKIQYRQFDWKIYHSPHFNVYYYTEEEALLQKVVSFAESAYDHLSREFDHQIQEPTPLIFYATHSAFEQNNIIVNFIPEGVGAFASPARNRMVLPVDSPDPELMQLITHELTHIFEYDILFQGSFGKSVASNAPQWLMEGLASYMAKDEQTHDRMFIRDAVVNDIIPQIAQSGNVSGFFAYRFGHALFDFMEERWGKDGVRDFLYEFRNTIGANVGRAVERTFRMTPEDFDTEFRKWLRKKYLPQLVEMGEPSDFGRAFRVEEGNESEELSPVASPSGDLVASFSTVHNQVDAVLFDAPGRKLLRSLTRGYTNSYQYPTVQFLTTGRMLGRDLAFSPDGNQLAAFAKREAGRALVLIDVVHGGLARVIDMDVEQQLAPAWSPDGRSIAFAGARAGQFDLFVLDLESGEIRNLTNDDVYDGAPAYSPDGKWLVYSAVVGGFTNLFRIDLADPSKRYRLTTGEWNDTDATFSSDGAQVYFTSDRNGADNIYRLDLTSGQVVQFTNALTGCFTPTVLKRRDAPDGIVYTGYWRNSFNLYVTEADKPLGEPMKTDLSPLPEQPQAIAGFEPDIEVTLDKENEESYGGFKLFLEDAGAVVGVDTDQTFLADTYLTFSDYLGNKRVIARISSVESFSNFNVSYYDLSHRMQWGASVFDDRAYYIGYDYREGRYRRLQNAYTQTGALGFASYPLDFYRRVEFGGGYIFRKLDYTSYAIDPNTGDYVPVVTPRDDDFPVVQGAFIGDTARYASYGPVAGHRYRLNASYAPDTKDSGTLTSNVDIDVRQYVPITQRSQFAWRLFAGFADGKFPSPYYFGGLDTLRGFDFRSLVGDRAAFANLEYRFPLIDQLWFPFMRFQGIRGRVFLDVGYAYFSSSGLDYKFWNSDENRLQDGVSSYGWGITIRFAGLDLNWDFAKQWDFKQAVERDPFGNVTRGKGSYRTEFWIGTRF